MLLNKHQYQLETRIDSETGELGLAFADMKPISGVPSVATVGYILAHDLIEHRDPSRIGSVWDELKALSVVWQVRGQYGEMVRGRPAYHSPESDIASDFVNLARYMFYGATGYTWEERHEARQRRHAEDCDVETFDEIARLALGDFPHEVEGRCSIGLPPSAWFERCFIPFARNAWIVGERQFVKTWGDRAGSFVNNLFWDVAETCDKLLRTVEYEGQRFILHVDHKRGSSFGYETYNY